MNKYLWLFLTLVSFSASGQCLSVKAESIIDGDTFSIRVNYPPPLNKLSVRILGIDTPESFRPKCLAEKVKGLKAKEYLNTLIKGKTVDLTDCSWDKWGGRLLAKVELNGVDIGEKLIFSGLAVPYFGKGPKKDWCK